MSDQLDSDQPTPVQQPKSTYPQRKALPKLSGSLMLVVCVVLVIAGFLAGIQYQKSKTKASGSPTMAGTQGQFGGRGYSGRRAGGLGTVTAVSSTSITITPRSFRSDSSSDTTKTYTITSATTIIDNGSTVTTSDIQTGDTVLIRTSGSGSTTATTITVNPTMGSGMGMPSGQSDSSPSSDDSSSSDPSSI